MDDARIIHDDYKKGILNCMDDLYRYALSICHDTSNAEDLVSETVLKALENKNNLKDKTKLKQWMLRVLTNNYIDQNRKANRVRNVSLDMDNNEPKVFSLYEMLLQSTFTDNNTPEINLIQKLRNEEIHAAISQLPDTFRIAFVLCEIEELSYKQIASMLKIKTGTVRSRIARARSMLQKILWDSALESGIKVKQQPKMKKVDCNC